MILKSNVDRQMSLMMYRVNNPWSCIARGMKILAEGFKKVGTNFNEAAKALRERNVQVDKETI